MENNAETSFTKALKGYQEFRKKYALGDKSVMHYLSHYGQQPQIMIISCCDSRVDPALILQCDPGDLFVVRNVANIVPPYEKDEMHHGTSAALEFGVRFLEVKHLILLGHSQCGGIQALLDSNNIANNNDFITNWVSLIKTDADHGQHDQKKDSTTKNTSIKNISIDEAIKDTIKNSNINTNLKSVDYYAKMALNQSYQHCLTFPWVNDFVMKKKLFIHLWFFDIKIGQIFTYSQDQKEYLPLDPNNLKELE